MMTLDEARTCLGIPRTAGVEEIREAFRRRAREVHPDRHPGVDSSGRKRLELEFDRVRTARDILVTHVNDPRRMPTPTPSSEPRSPGSGPEPTSRRAYRESQPGRTGPTTRTHPAPPRTAPPTRSAPTRSAPPPRAEPPRVTLRFDEFVEWTDALGFRSGKRAPRPADWTRIAVWSVVGAAILAVATEGFWVPLTF